MTLIEIKKAIAEKKAVRWKNDSYKVYQDNLGQYLITYIPNGHTVGLTHQDGVQVNGSEQDFYIQGI